MAGNRGRSRTIEFLFPAGFELLHQDAGKVPRIENRLSIGRPRGPSEVCPGLGLHEGGDVARLHVDLVDT